MEGKAKYYYLYKITNLINEHFYYGVHRTNGLNDGYMGSGSRLKNANVLEFQETKNIKVDVNLKNHKRLSPKDIYKFNFKNKYFLALDKGDLFYVIDDNGTIIQKSRLEELAKS